MAKIATPVQEISDNSENSLKSCALIWETNSNPFVDFVEYNCEDHHQSRKFEQFPLNIEHIYCTRRITCIFFQWI